MVLNQAAAALFYRPGRPWAREKLGFLKYYLGGVGARGGGFMKATQRTGGAYYIDLFAGPGQVQMNDGEIIDGSPLIAARASPLFAGQFWVDADPRNVSSLRMHRTSFTDRRIHVLHGDANVLVDEILDWIPPTQPALAFLDPEGSELAWTTVRKIARHKGPSRRKIEQLILFPTDTGISRFFPHDPTKMAYPDRLDWMLPDPQAWRALYAVRRELPAAEFRRRLLELYLDGLRGLGYGHVPPPALVRKPDNRPLYFIVFATDHPAGEAIMTAAFRAVDSTRSRRVFSITEIGTKPSTASRPARRRIGP